ncbi:chorismate-binding protein [Salegentibacter sp. F188]|uniref:Chorismate-binding protein n=1 Tax=Autumnicola patrickiae TaxID=3075591 RepID=A0ABU3DWT4_9FLAO|nr:chorismate-binding protein [Salegentibacter sp. F188]MDT0688150.1 chorismate-binding protein [Salegentibacter sp. F188]
MINSDEFFVKLEEQIEKGFPFVAYRKPGIDENPEYVKALLQQDAATHKVADYSESGFVFSPFEVEKGAFIIPPESSEEIQTEYYFEEDHKDVKKVDPPFPPNQLRKQARVEHEDLVQKALDTIKEGKLRKVVLSRTESVQHQLKVIGIFKNMLKKYNTAFVYLWFHPATGAWLGATPETLLQVERNKFRTMALAGTQAFQESTDVEWGEKEKEEQQIVTDAILENLQELNSGAGSIKASKPYTSRAGNLLHLRTDISGTFHSNSFNLHDLIKALHPTPAVCGLPKEPAKKFILKNEGYDREFYTGFLGELNLKTETKRNSNRRNQENQAYVSISKQTSLYVNLRCIKLEAGVANLFVGGGITAGSNPSLEWEETVNKSHTMKAVLVK